MSSCWTPQINHESINQSINQSISRSTDHSINQSNWLMANSSSMILSQEACWNDTTYRKHMETNLEIYGLIRSILQIVSVVSSIRVEAVSLTLYFLVCKKWFWFLRHFYGGCFVAKEVSLKCEHGAGILAII